MRSPSRLGFTAIELVIVVIIIGLLVGVGIAQFSDFNARARKSTCIGNQEAISLAFRLAENERTPVEPNTVLRVRTTGHIDPALCPGSTGRLAGLSAYYTWLGQVPISWGAVSAGSNSMVRNHARDDRVFRCPEDALRFADDNYFYSVSNIMAVSLDPSGTVAEAPPISATYTIAKNYLAPLAGANARPLFNPASPATSQDPLEGFNWIRMQEEWQSATIVFCRRWGRRNPFGFGGLGYPSIEVNYLPSGMYIQSHSRYAPTK